MLIAAVVVLALVCGVLGYLLWISWETEADQRKRASDLATDCAALAKARSDLAYKVIYRNDSGFFQGKPLVGDTAARVFTAEEAQALADTAALKAAEAEKLQTELSAHKVAKLRRDDSMRNSSPRRR